jgi:tubulin beta
MTFTNREMVNIQVGSAGINIGNAWWGTICKEHSVDNVGEFSGNDDQLTFLGTYFQERSWGRFVPRNISTDLEFRSIDKTLEGPLGAFFSPDSFVCSQDAGTSNLYSRAYNITGQEIIEKVLVTVRREVEQCDNCVGFQFVHSLSGGAGSGLTALILNHLYDLVPDEPMSTYSIFPSRFISENTEENYNTMLGIQALNNFTTLNVCYDNYVVGLNAMDTSDFISTEPNKSQNDVLARSIANLTCTFRFRGAQMTSPGKIGMNLTPFSKLHFVCATMSPYNKPKYLKYKALRSDQIVNDVLNTANMSILMNDANHAKTMGSALIFRGKLCLPVMERLVCDLWLSNPDMFVQWVPNPFLIAHCYIPDTVSDRSATGLHNTTAIASSFRQLRENVGEQYKRRAFFHHYVQTGIKEADFEEAIDGLDNICDDYEKVLSLEPDTQE